jgi:hypothetical protein
MPYKALAFTLGTILVAVPAAAADPQSNTVAAKPTAKEKTYCLQYALDTGSRINRVDCKTKKEWARLGVDVDDLGDK